MFSKVFVLFAVVVAASAMVVPTHLMNTGVSARSQTQDGHLNYAFGYDIKDAKGASNSRSEVGDGHGNKKGSYTLMDIDGRARKVEYVADGHGFRAVVKTNEPGTAMSAPAAAVISSPYGMPVAPVIKHVAPVATGIIGHGGMIGVGNGLGLGGMGLGMGGIGLGMGGLGMGGLGVGMGKGLLL